MKVLFLATYGDFLATFELSNIKVWKNLGFEVHCASNFSDKNYNRKINRLDEVGAIKHEICFSRSPFDLSNINSFRLLIKLIKTEKIDVIDCHNAVIGAFARLAAKVCGVRKVVYTPHSLFFYKGCPLKNRIIFKPVETWLSRITDLLISINKEDYDATSNMPLRGKAVYVPGIGVDTEEIFFLPIEREKFCKELNIPLDSHIYISVGELIPRKDHLTAIDAFAKANIKNAYYLICGIGQMSLELKNHINEIGMEDRIKLLGYRNDVKSLMKASDVFLFPSLQEGLPVALMEAMACGLPCLVSEIRGNVDLIQDGQGGYLFNTKDVNKLCELIQTLDKQLNSINFGSRNKEVIQNYDIKNVKKIMKKEYEMLIKE